MDTMDPHRLVGTVIDERYRVDEIIGRGGMGAVYRGLHLRMEQRVAIKVLHSNLNDDPVAAKRFIREAKSTFRFDHQNCVRVTDFGATPDGTLYLIMEYLDGRTIRQELSVDGPMSSSRAAHVLSQVAYALDHAHTIGLVHRDLKPANIMLLRRGNDPDFVKVLDFGLAKLLDDGGKLMTMMTVSPLTQAGMTFGTPHYMSPEQAMGATLDPRTDIYSLGAVGYELITGRTPFAGKLPMEVLTAHIQSRVPAPSAVAPDLAINPELEALLLKCLAKDPDGRPSSAQPLADQLAMIAKGAAVPAISKAVAAHRTVDLGSNSAGTVRQQTTVDLANKPWQIDLSPKKGPPIQGMVPTRASAAAPPRDQPSDPSQVVAPAERAPIGFETQAALDAVHGPAKWPLALAAVVAGVVTIAYAIAQKPTRADQAGADAGAPVEVSVSIDSAVPSPPKDAAPVQTGIADAQPTLTDIDAGPTTAAVPVQGAKARRIAELVRTGRGVRKAGGSALRQMGIAGEILTLDPKNRDGNFLMGDALVRDGDQLEKGCRHLRRARTSEARRVAKSAGCR